MSSVADALDERAHPWTGGVKRFERALRAAGSADRVPGLRGPEGRIDFERGRALYGQGDSDWKLFAPGSRYIGKPGEWYADERDRLGADDPFWVFAILEATVEATRSGDETVLGKTCQLYTGTVDFKLATGKAARHLDPPLADTAEATSTTTGDDVNDVSPAGDMDGLSLAIEVWLDDAGRICRAVVHGRDKSVTKMELWGFAEPDPIALPGPGEILPE